MYIYISNESEYLVDVFFDDLKVEHAKSPVVESQDYYPFGLTYNNFTRENAVANRWKFQGQEHVDDLGLNWDSFKWRNHLPDIGRFFNVDPLAEDYYYNSPYAFSENKVTTHVELEGLEAEWIANLAQHVSQNPDGAVAGATGFVVGLYNSTVGSVINMVSDPVGTVGSISKMAPGNLEGAVELAAGMVVGGQQKIDQVQNGTAFEKGVVVGEVTGTIADLALGAKGASALRTVTKTEEVVRVMSKGELRATETTGLVRGGREGTHYVTNAASSDAKRARQRLALPQTPEVKVTVEVPQNAFSKPTKVKAANSMPGGGLERTGTGNIPAKVKKVEELRNR